MSDLTPELALEALKTVNDPELHKDLVSLGMIEKVDVEGNDVSVKVMLTTPACPMKAKISSDVRGALVGVGFSNVHIEFGAQVRAPQNLQVPGIKHVVAVASGKGGVGKSTVAANLAISLAKDGAKVGLLDADIYGPSQAKMFGIEQEKLGVDSNKKMIPINRYGVELVSIANIVPAGQALVWRGPILHGTLKQFVQDVVWGDLDYLIIDMPPGTGDVQLSLSQLCKVSGAVIVTTPQDVARIDAERAVDMFKRVQIDVLGVLENMSFFEQNGTKTFIFGQGGGAAMAEAHNTAFLGEVPIAVAVREGGDAGVPITIAAPDSPEAIALRDAARLLAGRLSVQSFQLLPMA